MQGRIYVDKVVVGQLELLEIFVLAAACKRAYPLMAQPLSVPFILFLYFLQVLSFC